MVMKKNYFAFVCAICALTLFSCQKEDNTPEEEVPVVPAEEEVIPDGYTQLTLSAVSDETKTTLDGTAVKWAPRDQIKVYCSDESAYDFELVGEGGSATGDFTGLVPSGKTALYAVYPKDLYSSVSSTTVNVTIPAAQEGTFGKGNIAVAKVDGEHNMAFKNVNAFVGFTVGADITKVVVSSVGGEDLSGTLAVDCSGETPVAGALSDGGSSITVTFPASTGGTYYVAIAPGITHSKGLLLTWYNGTTVTGTYWLNKAITTAANNVYDMETVSADGHYYVSVEGAGKKNGMNVDNAWSASQFWSKLHPGGSDTDMDNAKLANINGATFHLAEGTYNWGTDAEINISESETISFTIQGDSGTIFTGNKEHRILTIDGNMSITFDGITFTNGVASGETEEDVKGGAVLVKAGSHSFIDCTFSGNSAQKGGAIDCLGTSVVSISGGLFSSNTATHNGGAIAVEAGAKLTVDKYNESGAQFIGNSCDRYGGALDIESGSSSINNLINDAIFKGNHANNGGAVATDGPINSTTKVYFKDCSFGGSLSGEPNYTSSNGGGAILTEGDSYVNVETSTFIGNYAKEQGGAICMKGWAYVDLLGDSFIGNHAKTGGVAYTEKTTISKNYYPRLFIDECSFDANYITNHYGCVFNINGADSFCMHNSSIRDASITVSAENEDGSWIDFTDIQKRTSISNSSIIGDAAGSALIWACSGSWTNYFTNNIITSSSSSTESIHSEGPTLDFSYNHFYSASSFTNNGGNVSEVLSGNIDGLSWSNTSSYSYYWKWNGTFGGNAPTKTGESNVQSRVNTASKDFINLFEAGKAWSSTSFANDQRRVGRGDDNWWPGAYQN